MTGDPVGVRRLAKEMILTAWRDCHGGYLDPNPRARRQAASGARYWLEHEDSGAISLSECCEVLELDPDGVRRYLLAGPPKKRDDDGDVDLADAG